jgi:CBS domain containing-hemolysin-like protein
MLFSLIALIIMVFIASFTCSLIEATLLSIQPAWIGLKLKKGRGYAKLLEKQKDQINRSIGAVVTCNTFSNTLGASLIGSKVYEIYGEAYVTFFSVVLTIMILIVSEILPKLLGTAHWKIFAPFSAYATQTLIWIFYPAVMATEKLGKWFGAEARPTVTREEMIMQAEIGAQEGAILKNESTVIRNLLMLDNVYVSDIMTPRSVMFALESDMTVEEVGQKYKPIRYSRIPVYKNSLDYIIGMTHRYKILEALMHDQDKKTIGEITIPIQTVSEKMSVSQVIDFFIKQKEHISLAVDEYGVITGLVSLEDAVETLLGVEIVDEFDSVTDLRQYALEQWQARKTQLRK